MSLTPPLIVSPSSGGCREICGDSTTISTISQRSGPPFAGPFPLVGKLVEKNLRGSPSRIGASIAAIALVTSAFVGLKGMTRSLAREFGPKGVRVNALAPGWIMTAKQREMWVTEEALNAHLARQCLPDPLEPEDILGPTLFLASTASGATTGQTLVVDGGVVVTG